MTKKQARTRQDSPAAVAKPALVITPQIAVVLQGTAPDQGLWVEAPNNSGSRHKIELTPANAYSVLMDVLCEKAGEIELERQLAEERRNKPKRRWKQPDWRLIAKHPEATIIQRLPTKASQLAGNKAEQSLEDMGL